MRTTANVIWNVGKTKTYRNLWRNLLDRSCLLDLYSEGRILTGWVLGEQIVGICPKENWMPVLSKSLVVFILSLSSLSLPGSDMRRYRSYEVFKSFRNKLIIQCTTLTALFISTGNIQSTRVRIILGTRVAKEWNVLRNLARRSSSLVMLLVLFCAEHIKD
jgi:hypothetical protein